MKVFITGATGYLGSHIAQAFLNAGHSVWGLSRDESKLAKMEKNGVHPVHGSMQQPESYSKIAHDCDVLIHTAYPKDETNYDEVARLDALTVDTLILACKQGVQSKALLYTSGVWIYGPTSENTADETAPLNPLQAFLHRPPLEEKILNAQNTRSFVMRPGVLYGDQGGLVGKWFFQSAADGKPLQIIGMGENHWAMAHVEDVAEAYLRAGENGKGHQILNLTDGSRPTLREVAAAAARGSHYSGRIQCVPVELATQQIGEAGVSCFTIDQTISSDKARELLQWKPKHDGFAGEAESHFASWRSFKH